VSVKTKLQQLFLSKPRPLLGGVYFKEEKIVPDTVFRKNFIQGKYYFSVMELT